MNKHGDFNWYELMTPDPDASIRFYEGVLDWSVSASSQPDMDYREIKASEGHVGGMLRLSPEMEASGARPAWLGYIAVDDVDAAASSVEQGGGRTYVSPRDIPGVGRFAMVADPQGAPFYIMKGASDGTSHAFAADRPMVGHCAWNELSTSDPEAAKTFYGTRFGWVKDGDLEMGPLGRYEFLRHGHLIGAVMPLMPQQPAPAWTFYFRVADIDRAAAAVTAGGGQILQGPMEIPGGEYSVNALDPQGAHVGLVGPRKQEAA
jgi:predicted enzyme related to lactoylglutathione lyase